MMGEGKTKGGFMLGNLLFTAFYLFVGLFLAFVAWTGYFSTMSWFMWLAAGAFLLTRELCFGIMAGQATA